MGLGSGAIPNNRMTASSYFATGWEPWRGRLGHRGGSSCWGAKQNRVGEYLQVDLGQVKQIVKIATQGRADANYWVKAFELRYSLDKSQWTRYKVNGVAKVSGEMAGCSDDASVLEADNSLLVWKTEASIHFFKMQ